MTNNVPDTVNHGPSNYLYRLWGPYEPVQGRPNTILVHGASIRLGAGGIILPGHIRNLSNNCFCNLGPLLHNELYGGHNIWEFEYADQSFVLPVTNEHVCFNFGDLTEYGTRLGQAIEIVKRANQNATTNIVAHSMGGLVARYAAQDGAVNKIVTLDTGHFGFDMAGFFAAVLQNLPRETWENERCVEQTAPGSEFLNNLNTNFHHCRVNLFSLAAGAPLLGIIVVSLESSHLGEVSNDGIKHYNEHCTPYRSLQNENHLSIIEIYDEYRHPAFDLIRLFLI